MFPQDIVYMKYTLRNIKKRLQPNRRKTNKLYYNTIRRFTRKKHGKKVKKTTGGSTINYVIDVEPSSFFKLIQEYKKDGKTIDDIEKKMIRDNLYLFNIIFKGNKEVDPRYYGNETEELLSSFSAAANGLNNYNSKKFKMEFDYNGKSNSS
jgi:hypothetical protein